MRKVLAVLEFIVGGFLLAAALLYDLPRVIAGFAHGGIAYALGTLVGTVILGALGWVLIRHGSKVWSKPTPLD